MRERRNGGVVAAGKTASRSREGSAARRWGRNIWKPRKRLFPPRKLLKPLKTAKGIFGNVWRIQASFLEKFGEKLGKIWRACPSRRQHRRPLKSPGAQVGKRRVRLR